jgi:hypothetical protein
MKFVQRSGYIVTGFYSVCVPCMPGYRACQNGVNTSAIHTASKSKRIPSIFNDESTDSFIWLRRHIYMSHVNKVQPIRVKMMCIAEIRVTCMEDFVSVVKILLKAFFFCSLFPYPPPPPSAIRAPCTSSYSASPTPSCNKRDTTYSYVTCSKVNAKSSRTSSDVTI